MFAYVCVTLKKFDAPPPVRAQKRVCRHDTLAVPVSTMTLQIVIPSSQNSQNQDPQLVLIEFQGTLECNQHDLRGISVGDLEEDNKVCIASLKAMKP